ncbi:hypothetical protein ACW9UR_16320 [Halovulum sp. GXIMD14794]
MSVVYGVLPVLGLIAFMLAALLGLNRIARAGDWALELRRKIVHVATGALAISLPWVLAQSWQVWLMLGFTTVALVLMRTGALGGLGQAVHGVERQSWGDYLLVLGVALTFALHDGRAVLYVLPLAVLTVADAAAALAGLRYGRTFYSAGLSRKSLEGSTIFFLLTLILSMVCLLLLTDVPRANVIAISGAIAGFATLVEADSWQGFDNLFVPMGVLIFLTATLDATVAGAVVRVGIVSLASGLAFLLVRGAGLSAQVARVYALAAFMLLSVAELHDVLIPAIYLSVQIAIDRDAPGRDDRVLRAVAALALVSFGFLAAGPLIGAGVVDFYLLGVSCMIAATVAVSAAGLRSVGRVAAASAGFAAMLLLWQFVVGFDAGPRLWHGPLTVPGAIALALAAGIPLAAPRPFRKHTVATVAGLGAGLALALLLWTWGGT